MAQVSLMQLLLALMVKSKSIVLVLVEPTKMKNLGTTLSTQMILKKEDERGDFSSVELIVRQGLNGS